MAEALADAKERLRLVRDSAAAVLPRAQAPQRVRALRRTPPGFDRVLWRELCALGWCGLRVPEERGGAGLDVRALCAVAEALGAALAPEPFGACAVAAQRLDAEWLAAALAGRSIVVPAWREQAHDLGTAQATTRLRGGRVDGHKHLVVGGGAADAFVVATADGLALVRRDAPGVTVAEVARHDGGFVADLRFDGAPADALPGSLDALLEEAALCGAAYLLGAMQAAFDSTLEHLRTRRQFGRAIGSFQALQHRAVDLQIQIALTRAVLDEAAAALDGALDNAAEGTPGSDADRRALVSRAVMRAGDAASLVAREAVQFHGAMGITDECDIGLYLRKILAVRDDWGSVLAHRRRYAAIEQARHA